MSRGLHVNSLLGEILAKLGRTQDAEDIYRALLEQNSDNLEYYRGFLRIKGYDICKLLPVRAFEKLAHPSAKPLEPEAITKILSSLDAFSDLYSRSSAPKRLALNIAQGESDGGS